MCKPEGQTYSRVDRHRPCPQGLSTGQPGWRRPDGDAGQYQELLELGEGRAPMSQPKEAVGSVGTFRQSMQVRDRRAEVLGVGLPVLLGTWL